MSDIEIFIAELSNGAGLSCNTVHPSRVDDFDRGLPLRCSEIAVILCNLNFPNPPIPQSWLKARKNQLLLALGCPSESGPTNDQEILGIIKDTPIYQRLLLYTCAHIICIDNSREIRESNLRKLQKTDKEWKSSDAMKWSLHHRKMTQYFWGWLYTDGIEQSHVLKCLESMNDVLLYDMNGIANQLVYTLPNETTPMYAPLKGNDAQALIDLLHALLTYCCTEKEKNKFYKALLELCERSKLYPTCLALGHVDLNGEAECAGRFADVWKHEVEGCFVAIKVVRSYAKPQTEHVIKAFSLEAVKWAHMSHPNILQFHGVFYLNESRSRIGFVSPWCENGTIVKYCKAHPTTDRMSLLLDAARGLNYLHSRLPPVGHGGLTVANILINSLGRACLADFGFPNVVAELQLQHILSTAHSGGTARWMAPERIAEPGRDDMPASDIYAFAYVCFEIFSGDVPFHDCKNDSAVIMQVMLGQRPSRPAIGLDDAIWKLVEDCWQSDPAERPTADTVAQQLEARMNSPHLRPQELDTGYTIRPHA